MCIKDLDEFNLNRWFDFKLKSMIVTNAIAASKNASHFKSGQKWLKTNHLDYFTKLKSKSLIHSMVVNEASGTL